MYVFMPNIDDVKEIFETAKEDTASGLILLLFLQMGAMDAIKDTFGLSDFSM
jgi:hypothetical protein